MDFIEQVAIHPVLTLFQEEDMQYSRPEKSFWMRNPGEREESPMHFLAKVLSINESSGTMEVIGIDHDIRIDVPITQAGFAADDFWGDLSRPVRGWHVLLARTASGDYYPIRYIRPYHATRGWSHEGHQHGFPGDLLIQMNPTGGRIYASTSGEIELAAGPNSFLQMYPPESDEKGQWIMRTGLIQTEVGGLSFEKEEDEETTSVVTLEGFVAPGAQQGGRLKMGKLEDETGSSLEALDASGAPSSGIYFHASEVKLFCKKGLLGGDDPISNDQPIPRGKVLLQRIEAIESKLSEIIQFIQTHTHAVGPDPVTTLPTALPVLNILTPYIEDTAQLLSDVLFIP